MGLERGTVELASDHEAWRRRYEREVERLRGLVGDAVRRFEHVGSTAVEGLCAKPVVDVLALVDDLGEWRAYAGASGEAALVETLTANGYEFRPDDVDGRLFFAKGPRSDRTLYLHVAEDGGPYARELLVFRDVLRSDSGVRDEYARLKRELAAEFPDDRESYTERKGAFVERVLDDRRDSSDGDDC